MAELIQLQIDSVMTAGKHDACIPDFLAKSCLVRWPTGEIEYDFSQESYISSKELSEIIPIKKTLTKTEKKRRGKQRTPLNMAKEGRSLQKCL